MIKIHNQKRILQMWLNKKMNSIIMKVKRFKRMYKNSKLIIWRIKIRIKRIIIKQYKRRIQLKQVYLRIKFKYNHNNKIKFNKIKDKIKLFNKIK